MRMDSNFVMVLMEKEVVIMVPNPEYQRHSRSKTELRFKKLATVENVSWARIIDGITTSNYIPLVGWR